MKKLILIALLLLGVTACNTGVPVNNPVNSGVDLTLMGETPEGAKIYKMYNSGYPVVIVVSKDGNSVAAAQH